MASPASTFATLRALQLVIADALDDIHRVFAQNSFPDLPPSPSSPPSSTVYACSPDLSPATSPFPTTPPASFPPTPLSATFPSTGRSPTHTDAGVPFLDYPSPDLPVVPNSPSEQLAIHPDVAAAASRIVAACGQMSSIVHKPFSSLCDATMSYNLPACMRLVEHLHIAEIIREAEENKHRGLIETADTKMARGAFDVDLPTSMPDSRTRKESGLHVVDITNVIHLYVGKDYIDPNDLVHALRLLSTHHIFRETVPDTFALTRISSLLDSGKSVEAVFSNPETKYDDAGAIPAFVALGTDELFKSAAYLTEAFTGVQLPRLSSISSPSRASDAILPGPGTIPSTSSFVINDPVPCAPTTRSSSLLTHIMYPEDEIVESSLHNPLSTEPPERDTSRSLANNVPPSSEPLAIESSVPPCLSSTEAAKQMEKEAPRLLGAAKPDKLPAFNLAFRTHAPFFEWLENGGKDPLGGTGEGVCVHSRTRKASVRQDSMPVPAGSGAHSSIPSKSFRFERFSKAMMGTTLWEAPKAILSGFDWCSLPKGSTIVDVGGGIGSTTMILARALNDSKVDSVKPGDGALNEESQPTLVTFPCHRPKVPSESDPPVTVHDRPQDDTAGVDEVNFRFVVQDKPVVTALGIEAWRSKCPAMLESGQVVFQSHDFFEPQTPFELPHLTRHPAVYLLRVVLHDWPDECARRILINLRVASNPDTRLVIAEHVLPLACVDGDVVDNVKAREESNAEEWTLDSVLANVEGAERTLVPPPLLSNLGKASANAYWMDLLMHITFNGKERTLREFCALALSAGWRVTRMTRPEGTLFAYLVCEPIALPDDAQAIHNAVVLSTELSTVVAIPSDEPVHHSCLEPSRQKQLPARPVSLLPSPVLERSSSRCGTPTFGSRMMLPKEEELQGTRTRGPGAAKKWLKSKGLGVRGVMMQKAEKQREEQNVAKGASSRDNDVHNAGRTSSPHMRVWWKKSPPNSTSNSSIAVHEMGAEAPEHRTTGRARTATLKSSGTPSTPSPRISPAHQKWPSTESTTLLTTETGSSVTRTRRPSVASITRKLSFATFGRRPSVADITEPLPTLPQSTTLTELAPPPTLRGDAGRHIRHLPSLPTLGRNEDVTNTAGLPPIPRRPSFSFVSQVPSPPVPRSTLPRRPDAPDSPKSSILKSRTSPHASGKQRSPGPTRSPESTWLPQRERRVTLANSPGTSSKVLMQVGSGVSVPPELAGPQVKRVPSMPKLPRRLSIPMLRRKQGQTVVQDGEDEG